MGDNNECCLKVKILVCGIYLERNEAGHEAKEYQMLLRILETLLNQLSSPNNKDTVYCHGLSEIGYTKQGIEKGESDNACMSQRATLFCGQTMS